MTAIDEALGDVVTRDPADRRPVDAGPPPRLTPA